MPDIKPNTPTPVSDSTTLSLTVVGPYNAAPSSFLSIPISAISSYTIPNENVVPSQPLTESAVRLGNSLLGARVPEAAVRRDGSEDF